MNLSEQNRRRTAKRQGLDKRMAPPGSQMLREPRRCAAGHLVQVWPCIECAIVREARLKLEETEA